MKRMALRKISYTERKVRKMWKPYGEDITEELQAMKG